MNTGYRVASIEELEIAQLVNSPRMSMLRRHFDIQSFGVNAYAAEEAGQDVIGEHDEVSGDDAGHHEEVYVVVQGKADFTVDGETFEGTPGAVVFVRDPAVKRHAVAAEANTRILAIGGRRGEPFTTSRWERSAPAFQFFASGEPEKAREVLEDVAARWPDDAIVLYNLACAESLTGRKTEALEHLGRSIELNPERFKELAAKDTDFDQIRDEPRFAELVASEPES